MRELRSKYSMGGLKLPRKAGHHFSALKILLPAVCIFSMPASAIISCGLQKGFQGDVQLYSKCGRSKADVLKIGKSESQNYVLGIYAFFEEEDCEGWYSISQKNPRKFLGYVKGSDAKVICSRGF